MVNSYANNNKKEEVPRKSNHCTQKRQWIVALEIQVLFCVLTRYTINQYNTINGIGGVMVRVLVSSAVDRGFESRSGQTKDY
jgi:hypothetical protein